MADTASEESGRHVGHGIKVAGVPLVKNGTPSGNGADLGTTPHVGGGPHVVGTCEEMGGRDSRIVGKAQQSSMRVGNKLAD